MVKRSLPDDAPLAYSVVAAGKMLGLGKTSTYKLIDEGELGFFKVLNRRRIPREEIERLIREKMALAQQKAQELQEAARNRLDNDAQAAAQSRGVLMEDSTAMQTSGNENAASVQRGIANKGQLQPSCVTADAARRRHPRRQSGA